MTYSSDPNGNIQKLSRTLNNTKFDDLNYIYDATKKNQLLQVNDIGNSVAEVGNDFKGSSNYSYDAIGNLISDSQAGITKITWLNSGKIKSILYSNLSNIEFTYEGQRVSWASIGTGYVERSNPGIRPYGSISTGIAVHFDDYGHNNNGVDFATGSALSLIHGLGHNTILIQSKYGGNSVDGIMKENYSIRSSLSQTLNNILDKKIQSNIDYRNGVIEMMGNENSKDNYDEKRSK